MILLDTNVISELMRAQPDEKVISWLDNQRNNDVWICSITQAEILVGLALLPEGKRKQGLVNTATAMFDEDFANRCKPFDSDTASHYATIVSKRTQQGMPISVEDAQIASSRQSTQPHPRHTQREGFCQHRRFGSAEPVASHVGIV